MRDIGTVFSSSASAIPTIFNINLIGSTNESYNEDII